MVDLMIYLYFVHQHTFIDFLNFQRALAKRNDLAEKDTRVKKTQIHFLTYIVV